MYILSTVTEEKYLGLTIFISEDLKADQKDLYDHSWNDTKDVLTSLS